MTYIWLKTNLTYALSPRSCLEPCTHCPAHGRRKVDGLKRPRRAENTGHIARAILDQLLENWTQEGSTANTRHGSNAGLMLNQRRRRWPNIKPALDPCIMLSWISRYPWLWFSVAFNSRGHNVGTTSGQHTSHWASVCTTLRNKQFL